MRLYDELLSESKNDLFGFYCRIDLNCKEYESTTKKQMIHYVIDFFSNPDNIIGICTVKELNFLQEILNSENYTIDNIVQDQVLEKSWQIDELRKKHILYLTEDKTLTLYEEIVETLKKAVESYDKQQRAEKDRINEFLIGYYKAKAILEVNQVIKVACPILKMEFDKVLEHIQNDKLFNYYVLLEYTDNYFGKGEFLVGTYGDYYKYKGSINKKRIKEKLVVTENITFKKYQNIFYYHVDIDNAKIAKFLGHCHNPFVNYFVREQMAELALFNSDRSSYLKIVKPAIDISDEESERLDNEFENAMDEVPSAVLNGFSRNELKKARKIQKSLNNLKEKINKEQTVKSRLSQKDAEKFYKLWYGILDFINKKYKINDDLIIYPVNETSGNDAYPIIVKLWEDFNNNIDEFCLKNPYKFTTQEVRMVQELKKGIRAIFTIIAYEEEYTIFACGDKLYKVKGLLDNIDQLIDVDELPVSVKCTLFPFKDQIVYDGLFIKSFDRMISYDEEEKLLKALEKGKTTSKL